MTAGPSHVPPARRILCATADPARRRALLGALAGPGREIECVRDGRQALKYFASQGSCDLLLIAHALPGIGGLALVRQLRGAGFDGRVVVTCASAPAATVAAYHAFGVKTIVIEPAPLAVLVATVQDAA